MDLFTHVLIAYLVAFGIFGPNKLQYVAAAALAGGLPDADALFFPLARRFPLLRHHGITHSIFGVTVIALAGAFLVPLLLSSVVGSAFASGSWLLYFLAMEGGGLCHVFLDGFTHFAVPPFAPFSKWELHLDADRAINLGTFAFTGFSFWLMLYERNRVPIPVWEVTAYALLAGYLGYLALRGFGRWQAGRVCRQEGFTAVAPTGNPAVFLLVEERKDGSTVRLRHEEYHVFGRRRAAARTVEFPRTELPPGPVTNEEEALQRSYLPALKQGRMLDMTYHSAEVRSAPGCWEVLWYSLEFTMLGRAAAVLASVDTASGRVQTKNAWMSPRRFLSGSA
jgi:membrane-bound metal-dependent hydrolase YbcI (DUF457 family)